MNLTINTIFVVNCVRDIFFLDQEVPPFGTNDIILLMHLLYDQEIPQSDPLR